MIAAQPSVGSAATWPTTGTIFSTAEVTRHGAARTPHPPSVAISDSASSVDSNFIMSISKWKSADCSDWRAEKGCQGAGNCLVPMIGKNPQGDISHGCTFFYLNQVDFSF
jgi:hypothetical protein